MYAHLEVKSGLPILQRIQRPRERQGGCQKRRRPCLTAPLFSALLTTPSVGDLIVFMSRTRRPPRAIGASIFGFPRASCAMWANFCRPMSAMLGMKVAGAAWSDFGENRPNLQSFLWGIRELRSQWLSAARRGGLILCPIADMTGRQEGCQKRGRQEGCFFDDPLLATLLTTASVVISSIPNRADLADTHKLDAIAKARLLQ